MTDRVFNKHKAKSIRHEDNPMSPSSLSPQCLCGDMPAMDGQWRSSRIVSVRNNRVLNKHYARSINTLIKTELVHDTQSAQQA